MRDEGKRELPGPEKAVRQGTEKSKRPLRSGLLIAKGNPQGSERVILATERASEGSATESRPRGEDSALRTLLFLQLRDANVKRIRQPNQAARPIFTA
jgi:hypothetical protein